MNEALIDNFNKCVKKDSLTYILGDTDWRQGDEWKRLNGTVVFLRGNHDRNKGIPYISNQIHEIRYEKERITLCHYPMRSWNASFHGSIHCHGHTHVEGKITGRNSIHVGVDAHDMNPVHIETVLELAKESKKLFPEHKV